MYVLFRFFLISLFFSISLPALSNPHGDLERSCDSNAVAVKVNGVDLNLALDATLKSYVILNPDSAKKVGLTKSSFSSAETYVRDKIIKGNVAKARIEVNEEIRRTRIVWFERNYLHDSRYDGVIGIGEVGSNSVKLNNCNHDKNPGEEFYSIISIPFKYQNNRVVIKSLLPDNLQVMLDFNRRNTNVGGDAYNYMLAQGDLEKLNSYAYRELEFSYYLPSRRVSLHSPILGGVMIDSENVFAPIDDHQMIDDPSGAAEGRSIDAIEDLVVYGYKAQVDSKFKSFIKIGRDSLPDCQSVTFDLNKKLVKFSCLSQKDT